MNLFNIQNKKNIIIISAILLGLIIGCLEDNGSFSQDNNKNNLPYKIDDVNISIFFSQTKGSIYSAKGVDGDIIQAIDNSKKTLRVAIYEFSNDNIRDAFLRANDRGIDIQMITDDKKIEQEDIVTLKNAGIDITADNRSSALMHNKFMIIDEKVVWSGSANYSYYAFYRHNENIIKMESKSISEVYLREFKKLRSHKLTKMPYVRKNIEIYFSPKDRFETRLLELISKAKTKIHFLAFSFTSSNIAELLVKKKKEGLEVKGVFDESQNKAQKTSTFNYLKKNKVDVLIDGGGGKLHSKVFIIDDKIVVTGSYNFSISANIKNNENSIVIHNNKISDRYENEFQKIYKIGKKN